MVNKDVKPKNCSVPECREPLYRDGYCKKHLYKKNLVPWKPGCKSPNPSGRTRGTEALEQVAELKRTLASVVKQMNKFFSKIESQIAALHENQAGLAQSLALSGIDKSEPSPEAPQSPMGGEELLAATTAPTTEASPESLQSAPEEPPAPEPIERQIGSFLESGGMACAVTDEEVMAEAERMGLRGQISAHELNEIRKKLAGEPYKPSHAEVCINAGATMPKSRRWFVPRN